MSSERRIEYSIVPITEKDTDRVIDFLNRFFFRDEPLNEYVGVLKSPEDRSQILEDFCAAAIPHGLSLMAVDPHGKILGVRLNELLTREKNSKRTADDDKKIEKCPDPGFKLILRLLDKVYLDTNPFQKFPEVDRVMGFKLLSVDTAYRCQGIAKALVEKAIALAREKGIPLLRTDCTSAYSAMAMVKLGFELVYSVPYDQYVDSSGRPVFQPPPPHSAVQSFVKRIHPL